MIIIMMIINIIIMLALVVTISITSNLLITITSREKCLPLWPQEVNWTNSRLMNLCTLISLRPMSRRLICKCLQNIKVGRSEIKHKTINDIVTILAIKLLICILSCSVLFYFHKNLYSCMAPPSISNKNRL